MKIVHICFSSPFVEGQGYQENILPQYQVLDGDEVYVISYNFIYNSNHWKHIPIGKTRYNNVNIIRLRYNRLGWGIIIPKGLYRTLKGIKPDIIMNHGITPISLPICAYYVSKNKNCKLIADNHADPINCNQNKFIKLLLYKGFISITQKVIIKYIDRYYGVTKLRCIFLEEMFGIPRNKIGLIPISGDIELSNTIDKKEVLRKKYELDKKLFYIICGGKLSMEKGISVLTNTIQKLRQEGFPIELILFGSFSDKVTENFIQQFNFIKFMNWCDRIKTLELLKLSDIAIWPVHHTTLCEDAVSVGTPLILKETGNTEHLIKGNGVFIKNCTEEDLRTAILYIYDEHNKNKISNACIKMKDILNYHTVANTIKTDLNLK